MLSLLLPLLLLAPLLSGAISGDAFEATRLTRCPPSGGSLTLTVPEDLPEGSTLLSWNPAWLSLKSGQDQYKRLFGRALGQRDLSPLTRAFFSDGLKDYFSVAPGASRVTLARTLPAGGPDLIRGRFSIACAPAAAATAGATAAPVAGGKFSLNLRLVRRPLRLVLEPRRPSVSRWSPAGAALANVSLFANGRRVSPAGCRVVGAPAGAALTVELDAGASVGRVSLTAPLKAPAVDEVEWTSASVSCEWRGRRARSGLPVAPFQLWRRRRTRLRVAAPDAALTGGRLDLDLGALLVRRGPGVRLLGARGPGRVRLAPAAAARRLVLDLPPAGTRLAVSLEAADAAGRVETASLVIVVVVASAAASAGDVNGVSVVERAERPWWPWWPVPVLAGAALLLCAACAWLVLRRRLRASPVVKPQFV